MALVFNFNQRCVWRADVGRLLPARRTALAILCLRAARARARRAARLNWLCAYPTLTLPRARQDLAGGYMSGKLLLKLDAVAFILGHHTAEHFAFLADPANSRARTAFYATLARLLFMEDTPLRFKAFVAPLQQARPRALCLVAHYFVRRHSRAMWHKFRSAGQI